MDVFQIQSKPLTMTTSYLKCTNIPKELFLRAQKNLHFRRIIFANLVLNESYKDLFSQNIPSIPYLVYCSPSNKQKGQKELKSIKISWSRNPLNCCVYHEHTNMNEKEVLLFICIFLTIFIGMLKAKILAFRVHFTIIKLSKNTLDKKVHFNTQI